MLDCCDFRVRKDSEVPVPTVTHIETDFWHDLCVNEGKLLHFDKGEEFVTVGHTARYIGYIQTGTMKYVTFSTNGKEHVVGLQTDGDFIADFPWSLYGEDARVSIIASTPCDIYCYPVQEIKKRMDTDIELKLKVVSATEAIYSTLYDRYLELYTKSPQQRYDALISTYPDLFKWFSLKDIASYLNITPTHLSRLKKNSKIHQ